MDYFLDVNGNFNSERRIWKEIMCSIISQEIANVVDKVVLVSVSTLLTGVLCPH